MAQEHPLLRTGQSQNGARIDQKSTQKSRKTTFATRIDKTAFLGAPVVAKRRFLIDFGVPDGIDFGSPNRQTRAHNRDLLSTGVPEASRDASGTDFDAPGRSF